jgi:hypothetical protein
MSDDEPPVDNCPFPKLQAYGLEEGETTKGILPAGARAWDEVLKPPLRFIPWPYSKEQFKSILAAFPRPPSNQPIELILFSARVFVRRMQLKDLEPAKPDARRELERIHDAIKELHEAIHAAGAEALYHLDKLRSPGAGDPPMTVDGVSHALHRFRHDNRFALAPKNLPASVGRGRPSQAAAEWIAWQIWTAWLHAHKGRPPKRGWPNFRAAAAGPLEQFGLRTLSDYGWQDLLSKAKARAQTPD